ncbi:MULTISPECIES: IS4 family transposase [unclassified Moorena]|uniref:IS4 family transposase n=1 Tax=unclassified Moorena TaxID=2683338 RepID=UPI0025CCCBC0|nr:MULTISPECIES: IS4 family transposase [unclassified Moorena]
MVVLGDREFCSPKLGKYLTAKGVDFCLRQKQSTNVSSQHQLSTALKNLGLSPGMKLFFQGVNLTNQKGFGPFNLAGKWRKNYREFSAKEPWYLLTNLPNLELAIRAYKKRFGIEEMFRDFKTGGYNLEETKLTSKRLSTLIVLISIAYTSACLEGRMLSNMGLQKYLVRQREPQRYIRRHSSFYVGIHAHLWVDLFQLYSECVQELMQINRHKLPNYLKGLRARLQVLSAL